MKCRRLAHIALLLVASSPLPGCVMQRNPAPEDKGDESLLSTETSTELFQLRCDESLLQAAVARWRDGDAAGCRMLLERLLNRNPDHLSARMMLADLHASRGDITAAENQFRWIIQRNPDNPQAHHSLGVLLETSGRPEQAAMHLQTAARLEPDNKLYALCYDAAVARLAAVDPATVR